MKKAYQIVTRAERDSAAVIEQFCHEESDSQRHCLPMKSPEAAEEYVAGLEGIPSRIACQGMFQKLTGPAPCISPEIASSSPPSTPVPKP